MCLEGRVTLTEWMALDELKRDAVWGAYEWWCEERKKAMEEDGD